MKNLFFFLILFIFFVPNNSFSQELHQDIQGVWRAEVIEASETVRENVPGTEAYSDIQTIKAEILEGERRGEVVEFENDYIQLESGDKFFLNYLVTIGGQEIYSVREKDRRESLFILLIIFVVTILFFGGKQGLRALISLVGSFFVIFYVLLPSLISGYSPLLISFVVSAIILFFAIFFTHGFNRVSLIAFLGTISAILITIVLTIFFVNQSALTGLSSDESVYLNIGTRGTLDFVGLLVGAIIIGALGALDDIAVTQVAVVRELYATNKNLKIKEVYNKAIRVGKEHVGALVNTLVLAYTGASLPLLLWFSQTDAGFLNIINREIFATEIIRTLLGSIGLILTVPITTYFAARFLKNYEGGDNFEAHSHSHHHIKKI